MKMMIKVNKRKKLRLEIGINKIEKDKRMKEGK